MAVRKCDKDNRTIQRISITDGNSLDRTIIDQMQQCFKRVSTTKKDLSKESKIWFSIMN